MKTNLDVPQSQPIGRVLIIEDDAQWLDHFNHALHGEGYLVQNATSLREARTALQQFHPDVVVLDMRLDEESVPSQGWQLLDEMKPPPYGPEVIIVTGTVTKLDEITDLTTKREFGGYESFRFLPKTRFHREIFRNTVRRANEEQHKIDLKASDSLKLRSSDDVNRIIFANDLEKLTPTELQVLEQLVAGNSNQEIAKSLFVSLNTVKTHVKNILTKLQIDSRAKILPLVLKLDLIR